MGTFDSQRVIRLSEAAELLIDSLRFHPHRSLTNSAVIMSFREVPSIDTLRGGHVRKRLTAVVSTYPA